MHWKFFPKETEKYQGEIMYVPDSRNSEHTLTRRARCLACLRRVHRSLRNKINIQEIAETHVSQVVSATGIQRTSDE